MKIKLKKDIQNFLFYVGCFVCLFLYFLFLNIPFPSNIGLEARYGILTILIVIFILSLVYQIKGWLGLLASLGTTLILFALPLTGIWNSGISESSIFSGLFPWNDANGYYIDARQTLEGNYFSTFSSRRPLFPAMLTFLLGITQENLQFSLAILVVVTAISCFFFIHKVHLNNGLVSALFSLVVIFVFYRRFAGTTLTTNLGLPLGLIGFTILWEGAQKKKISTCLLGTFFLTLALNARAGAFLVLPAILIWGLFCFRGRDRFSLDFLIGGLGVILTGFLLNHITLKIFGNPDGVAFSNFAHTLYGLVVGGKSWTQIYVDYPGVEEHEMYSLAFDALRQNPFGIVVGSLRYWYDYFNPNGLGAFSFIDLNQGHHPVITVRIRQTLYFLSYLSFLGCCYRWRKPENSLMIFLVSGIVLSVPFVPPSDADAMRAYAATIPITATLPALIFMPVFRQIKLNFLLSLPKFHLGIKVSIFWGFILVFFCFVAPIATKMVSQPSQFTEISCQNQVDPVYMKFRLGSFVNLVEDNLVQQTHLPNIRISDFKNGLGVFTIVFPELSEEFKKMNPGQTIMSGFDVKTGKFVFLIAERKIMPTNNTIIGICEQTENNSAFKKYNFLKAESIEEVKLN